MLVNPHVFPVIRSVIDEEGVREWLAYLGVKSYDLPSDQEKIDMGAHLARLCAKRCYMSFEVGLNPNITRVRDDLEAFITNILEVGHGCYDDKTEVLTKDGWKLWPAVVTDDQLATLNEKGEVEYHQPFRLVEYEYNGRMYRVEGQVDLLVTPDHKMLVCPATTLKGRKKLWSNYKLIPASEIDATSVAYLKGSPHRSGLSDSHEYALGQLYGFALGDGYVGDRGVKIRFHLKKSRKVSYLSEVVKTLGLNINKYQTDNQYSVTIGENRWLLDLYNDSREKVIKSNLADTSPSLLLGILDGLRNSDGSPNGDMSFYYDTTSETLAGQVQILAMHLGWTANISQAPSCRERSRSYGDKPIFRLIVTPRTVRPVVNKYVGARSKSEWIEDWQGTVYCAEVPNNTLFVRRNGKPVWSGNSVMEHVSYSFALEGVSRVFTAEMNRHRAGTAISEGSMRYIAFQDIPYWIPLSIRNADDDTPHIRLAKERTRDVFEKAFEQDQENYAKLQKIWNYREEVKVFSEKKKLTSLFRRIVGIGVATGGVWTGNLRALRHIFTMRCSPAAEEEICLVASEMLKRMMESEPLIFGDFHLVDGFWTARYIKV